MATARKLYRNELSNLVQKSGIHHKTTTDTDGINQHWVDEAHEDDGAQNVTGAGNEENFAKELNKSMHMLSNSGGLWTAWGDTPSAELDPQGVQEARKTEIR